ncbi:MAG: glycosyltransferase, partial [Mycobacteriales bacterium]
MRVLLSTTSGLGHVLPLVPLGQALLDAGHEVLWAAGDGGAALVEAAGLPVTTVGLRGDALAAARGAVQTAAAELPPPERAAYVFPRMFGEALAPPAAADLLPVARGFRPDLVVHEQGELAAPLVARLLDVPCWTHAFGGAVPAPFVAAAGERLARLWEAHGLEVPPWAGCFGAGYLDIAPAPVQTVPTDHITTVQPLRPVAWAGPGGPASLPWLERPGLPLVYLTLGTEHRGAALLADAVRELRELPVRVLVTVGPHGDPAQLGPQPEHVRVERWVPQTQVLPHAAVVASHAGSGTFLAAAAAGVPQLCLPQQADQFRNSEGGARSGAALVL